MLFVIAGAATLASSALGAFASPWFLLLGVVVGLNQLAYATTGICGASYVLRRVGGLRSSLFLDEAAGDR